MTQAPAPSAAPGTDPPFRVIAELVREHAAAAPRQEAIVDTSGASLDYGELDALMDRVAASLQRDGVAPGEAIAICGRNSVRYAALFLGALRAGVVGRAARRVGHAGELPVDGRRCAGAPAVRRHQRSARARRTRERRRRARARCARRRSGRGVVRALARARGDARHGRSRSTPACRSTSSTRRGRPARPRASSSRTACAGPTSCAAAASATDRDTVTLLSTPLYSNTTLVVFFPTIAFGGTVVLMAKFDVAQLPRARRTPPRHAHDARAGAVPAADGARRDFDAHDLIGLPHEVLHQRAVRGGAEGRRARALAGRAGRVLRHDRRRRHLHPRRARAPRQAPHRGPAAPKATTSA